MGYPSDLSELHKVRNWDQLWSGVSFFFSGRKVAVFKFLLTLSLVFGLWNNKDWYLRSLLSVIQVLTLEFNSSLASWEVSTVRFHPLIILRDSGVNKAVAQLLLDSGATHMKLCLILCLEKQWVAGEALGVVSKLPRPYFFFQWQIKFWPCGQAPSGSLQDSSLKSLKSLLSIWSPHQFVGLGLLSLSYKFI